MSASDEAQAALVAALQVQDYAEAVVQLENLELEGDGADHAALHLLLYVSQGDLDNARFLWKRLDEDCKAGDPEIARGWAVGRALWARDFPGTYAALDEPWSSELAPVAAAVRDTVRERGFRILASSYADVRPQRAAELLGAPTEAEAVQMCEARGWATRDGLIVPVAEGPRHDPSDRAGLEQLQQLATYVSFLEQSSTVGKPVAGAAQGGAEESQ